MGHVTLVTFSGFRIKEDELLELGMTLPGFIQRADALSRLPALGLLTLAGALDDEWTVSYHSPSCVNEELVECIVREQPTLVAISALTASIIEAYSLSTRLIEEGITTVVGGLHASVCSEEASRYASTVVVGHGEGVWLDLLSDCRSADLKPSYSSLSFRTAKEDSSYVAPWYGPRFDLLAERPARFTLQTHRGCPFACEFCGASRLLGGHAEKPLELIQEDLSAITSMAPDAIVELADDNTFAGPRDGRLLLNALHDSGVRWFTECDWRLGEQPELLARLAESGCRQVLVGIESLIFRYPGQGKKLTELQRVLSAIEAIHAAGVVVNGCFIVGAEGETRESLERLGDFVLASRLAEVQITLQTPFPGTGLYQRLQREGRILEDRDWSSFTLFDVTYRPDSMSVRELEVGYRELLKRVYAKDPTHRRSQLRREIWRTARKKRISSDS